METSLIWGTIPFVLCKLALVAGGSYLLWQYRQRAFAVIGVFAGFLMYYFLLIYHLRVMNLRLLQRRWS